MSIERYQNHLSSSRSSFTSCTDSAIQNSAFPLFVACRATRGSNSSDSESSCRAKLIKDRNIAEQEQRLSGLDRSGFSVDCPARSSATHLRCAVLVLNEPMNKSVWTIQSIVIQSQTHKFILGVKMTQNSASRRFGSFFFLDSVTT